jgi:hypothetical protein
LKLYEKWPKFKYKRAGVLNGRCRDVHPKCINSGAKYLLIDPSHIRSIGGIGHFGYGCAVPNKSIVLSRDFANEILDFLTFDAGRAISERKSISEDWSGMIWDLLEITRNSVARRKNSRGGPFKRQTHSPLDVTCFMAGNTSSGYLDDLEPSGDDGESGRSDDGPNDDGGGISVLYIRVEDSQS